MKRTLFCSVTLLSLWACLTVRPLGAAPTAVQSERPANNKPALGIDLSRLCQHWVHSSEEEQTTGKDQIFRLATAREFPPSRFRMAYKFARNGDCEWLFLSPDDDHHFKPGKWKVEASTKALLKITANGTTKAYRITELSKNILRLTPLPPKQNR